MAREKRRGGGGKRGRAHRNTRPAGDDPRFSPPSNTTGLPFTQSQYLVSAAIRDARYGTAPPATRQRAEGREGESVIASSSAANQVGPCVNA